MTYTLITFTESQDVTIGHPAIKGLTVEEIQEVKEASRQAAQPGDTITHNVIAER